MKIYVIFNNSVVLDLNLHKFSKKTHTVDNVRCAKFSDLVFNKTDHCLKKISFL